MCFARLGSQRGASVCVLPGDAELIDRDGRTGMVDHVLEDLGRHGDGFDAGDDEVMHLLHALERSGYDLSGQAVHGEHALQVDHLAHAIAEVAHAVYVGR